MSELACDRCIHKKVCYHETAFRMALEKIGDIYIDGFGWVKDVPWLGVDLGCEDFLPDQVTVRQCSDETAKLMGQMKFDEAVKKIVSEPIIAHVPRPSNQEEGAEWLL